MDAKDGMHRFDLKQDDLAARLGGGLPSGALVVMEGPVGAGKSVLCQRLTQGLMRNGARVAYVSTELTTRAMLAQMDSLGYGEAWQAIPDERFVFIPTHPVLGERAPRGEGLGRLLKARRLYEPDVIVFDTFSKLVGDHMADQPDTRQAMDTVEAVLHLFKRLTGLGKTLVLTLDPAEADKHALEPFTVAAEVFLRLEKERVGVATNRRIVVERMNRAARRYNETIGFRVEPRVGIVIEIKAVVG
ncbi:MAG TPA: ATPase domain-containing protein [Candidatus Thermoplasmatota archaeon]|nr:ATPase domain-containing protein [Candidatus Thermoplasmatota archaeon]